MIFWNFNKILEKKNFFCWKKFSERPFLFFRDGSMVPVMTLRLPKMFSWVRRTFSVEKESWPIAFPAILKILDFESILVIFHDFSQYFQQMLTSCSTNDDSSNLSWKHVFSRLGGQFNLYLNHIGPIEPKIEVKTFGPNLAQNANSRKNRLHPLILE